MKLDAKKLIPQLLLGLALLAVPAFGQPSISIDVTSPTFLPGGAVLLTFPAPGPGPMPVVTCGPAGLGIVPGTWDEGPELDALSNGREPLLRPSSDFDTWFRNYCFTLSTDEFANGVPFAPAPPNVWTEGSLGNWEASADLQLTCVRPGDPLAPLGPFLGPILGHTVWLDGNGFGPPAGYLGIGLIEPNPPFPGYPDEGDNVDAVDFRRLEDQSIYFSLDASYVDPIEGWPLNTSTAFFNTVLPGDVLVSNCGGGFVVYAPAGLLGLSEEDDLDALVLRDNGDGVYTPSNEPFDWIFGETDMLLFSVRRGSPLIGTPDAFFGFPIEEGDILTPSAGGPGIFIAAEVIGLATVRSGTAELFPDFGDDLNALSLELEKRVPYPPDTLPQSGGD